MFLKWFNRLILLVYALLIIVPLYFVFVSSFKTSSNFFSSPFSWPDRLHGIISRECSATSRCGSISKTVWS
ncbi:hypothetical protein [Paenibacillus sp. 1A_MP2]|uniref:hypothetical protein n=1 Tax=Paenibacillus sp. 1A_MP2 TaxID=3457495 RepID=UPI003FCD5B42